MASAECATDGASRVCRNAEHSPEVQDTRVQPLRRNEALCSRLHYSCYHRIPAFNASTSEDSKSRGRHWPRAGQADKFPGIAGSGFTFMTPPGKSAHGQIAGDLRGSQPFRFQLTFFHNCIYSLTWSGEYNIPIKVLGTKQIRV